MSAHTHTPSQAQATGSVDIRLPWWALALPMIAFVVLLLLIADPGQAQAVGSEHAVGQILERIQHTLGR
ncbi:hypothetical protein [Streptomyces sp. NBC_00829]|uniref:hypothetical protein n=1 Tax=Streptomyces sp. NBC_00829 TaxID=2903679 RepID=UPI0038703C12|nr:hypothetical protein OG293_28600 [Streptomyces sp. NBC_00829]